MRTLPCLAAGLAASNIVFASCQASEVGAYKYKLAIDQAGAKIADILALTPADLKSLGDNYERTEDLKKCLALDATSTKSIFADTKGKAAEIVFVTQGERSDLRLNIGKDCKSVVSLPPVAAIAVSYLAEAITKHVGSTDAAKYIIPVDTPAAGAPDNSKASKNETKLEYRTESGHLSIILTKSQNKGTSEVRDQNGKILYNEKFEFHN
ncbi:hypothetical protein [Methylobacterium aquaticum]|jgi:hypothetical protein|uniref:hypothetical protein n=1 Tax=Methylobacterium aquaticum TaxID=270351 RepID=UPI000AC8F560|nr:hypothetical protein [Methylobacterium aquaticum]